MLIAEARKALGKTGEKMTDEEIVSLERNMRELVNIVLDIAIEDIKKGLKK